MYCFCAALQDDCYALPLRLLGLPVKMLCPLMRPPSMDTATSTCHHDKMEVKINWGLPSSELEVKCKEGDSIHVPPHC